MIADRCAIVGVGNTAYTRGTDRSTLQLQLEASLAAMADAGVDRTDIDGVLPNLMSDRYTEEFAMNLGLRDLRLSAVVPMGGASVIASIGLACMAISSGCASCVLIPAGRRGYSGERVSTGQLPPAPITRTWREFELPYGNVVAAQWFAQVAQRHMFEYGTTGEQLGMVAVNSRRNANLNPQALMYGRPMTLEDHQSSPMISSPFRLLDCSLESDGAGAIIVTSSDRARDLRQAPVLIGGFGEGHGYPSTSITQKLDMASLQSVNRAASRAFSMAGIRPGELDLLNIHEAFSWFVIGCLEAIGAVGPGEGGPFVQAGHIALTGTLPVNSHGGSLSEGHVSGINHVIEGVRQLRRTVEPERQISGCEHVGVVTEGNFLDGSVLVLRR